MTSKSGPKISSLYVIPISKELSSSAGLLAAKQQIKEQGINSLLTISSKF